MHVHVHSTNGNKSSSNHKFLFLIGISIGRVIKCVEHWSQVSSYQPQSKSKVL